MLSNLFLTIFSTSLHLFEYIVCHPELPQLSTVELLPGVSLSRQEFKIAAVTFFTKEIITLASQASPTRKSCLL
jgi:hypothetical protein